MDRGFWPLREMSAWLWRERHQGVSEGKGPTLGWEGVGSDSAGPEALLALRQIQVGLEVSSVCRKVF